MNLDQVVQGLASPLPSQRMQVADWALAAELSDEERKLFQEAALKETVPAIRAALRRASRKTTIPAEIVGETGPSTDFARAILDDLPAIIKHELEPAIGWVRSSANRELEDFSNSATNQAVEALRRRLDGLIQLTQAHRLPRFQRVSLFEQIASSLPYDETRSLFLLDPPGVDSDEFDTDPGLFSLIIANAAQNAADGAMATNEPGGAALVAFGLSDRDFWLTIRNRFQGQSFEFGDIGASGRTTKVDHRGLGTRIMQLAAARLSYQLDVTAAGGVATLSLRGKRYA